MAKKQIKKAKVKAKTGNPRKIKEATSEIRDKCDEIDEAAVGEDEEETTRADSYGDPVVELN